MQQKLHVCFGLYFKIMLLEEEHRRQSAVTLGPENAEEGGKRVLPGKRSREEPADVKLPPSKKRHF